jgi:hypothetical protein
MESAHVKQILEQVSERAEWPLASRGCETIPLLSGASSIQPLSMAETLGFRARFIL